MLVADLVDGAFAGRGFVHLGIPVSKLKHFLVGQQDEAIALSSRWQILVAMYRAKPKAQVWV